MIILKILSRKVKPEYTTGLASIIRLFPRVITGENRNSVLESKLNKSVRNLINVSGFDNRTLWKFLLEIIF